MAYYWDPLAERWKPVDRKRKLIPTDHARLDRHATLIEALMTEMKEGVSGLIGVYAPLLTRALIESDELLIQGYAEQFKHVLKEEPHRVA
jgi:hypothetical protein